MVYILYENNHSKLDIDLMVNTLITPVLQTRPMGTIHASSQEKQSKSCSGSEV